MKYLQLLILAYIAFTPLHAYTAEEITQNSSNFYRDDRIYESSLDNGMRVVLIKDNRFPVVVHMIHYMSGSSQEHIYELGVANLLSYITSESNAISIAYKYAGLYESETRYDFTRYYQMVSKKYLSEIMDFEIARMVDGGNFDLSTFEHSKQIVLQERENLVSSNIHTSFSELLVTALFTNHPYRFPISGWSENIENISPENAISYFNHYYIPDNSILIIAGDIEFEPTIQLAREKYGSISRSLHPTANRHRKMILEPNESNRHNLSNKISVNSDGISSHYMKHLVRIPFSSDKEKLSRARKEMYLGVVTSILCSNKSSYMYETLVLHEKIASNLFCHLTYMTDYAVLTITIHPKDGITFEDLNTSLERNILKFIEKPIDQDMINIFAKELRRVMYVEKDDILKYARVVSDLISRGYSLHDIAHMSQYLSEESTEDNINSAKRYLLNTTQVTGYLHANHVK